MTQTEKGQIRDTSQLHLEGVNAVLFDQPAWIPSGPENTAISGLEAKGGVTFA